MMVGEELIRLLKEKPSLLKALRIKYSEEKSSSLVCDLNSVVVWLSGMGSVYCSIPNILDLDNLSSKIISFVRALRHIGVEPVFFYNSVGRFSCKEDFEFTLPQTRFEYIESIVHRSQRMDIFQKFALFCMNPLISVQAQLLLASLNVQILSAAGNYMSEAACFTVNSNALGLLSYNPEFALFPDVPYIHMDYFDLERDIDACSGSPIITPKEVICGYVTVDILGAELGLSKAGMADLAIILGNCFSLYLNDRYHIRNFIQLTGKGLNSVVTFLKGSQSPVFETCSKLSYFCDLNKEYRYAVSRSLALYNQPRLFSYHNEGAMAKWVNEKIIAGLLPSYFYTIVNFGICILQPFFENHSINHLKIHETLFFFRKILYFILGVERVFEYGCVRNKLFIETKVEITGLPGAFSKLKSLWSLPIESKCQLLTSLVMSARSNELSTEFFSTMVIQSRKCESIPNAEVCDGDAFDAIYVSVLLHLTSITLVLPSHCENTSNDISVVTEFSYVLQLVYDLAMLLGLTEYLPIPNVIYSPSLSLRILSLNSSSCYCHLCDKYYSFLIKKIFTLPSIQLLKMKCSNPLLENHDEMMSLLDTSVVQLRDQKSLLECILAKAICRKHCEIIEDSQHCLIHSASVSNENIDTDCVAVSSSIEPSDGIGVENDGPESNDDEEIIGGIYIDTDCVSSIESSSIVNDTIKSALKPKKDRPASYNDEDDVPGSSGEEELFNEELFTKHMPLAKHAVCNSAEEIPIDAHVMAAKQEVKDVNGKNGKNVAVADCANKQLSVMKHRDEIIHMINKYRVVCIEGEAGCGKSTMVPQFIMDSSNKYCKIIVCQPRRISAVKLARHVAQLRSQECGVDIGYCVGGEKNILPQSKIVYCTIGYLLQILLHYPERIENYTHIILDEIHDRSVTYDFVTLLLRKLSMEQLSCKLILMSATMQGPLFVKYFQEAFGKDNVSKPFYVGNKCYSVEEYFIDQINEHCVSNSGCFLPAQKVAAHNLLTLSDTKKINNLFHKLYTKGPQLSLFTQEFGSELIINQASCGASILVFLPGFHDILEYSDFLEEELKGRKIDEHFSIFVLHSQVPIDEQEALLQPPPSDKVHVILATNIAESSITIPKLNVVINFGLQKTTKYDYKRRMACLVKSWCSKAACVQRSGRVGRLSSGKVFHLFPKQFHDIVLPDYDIPEILSKSLSKTILHARVIGETIGMESPSDVLRLAIQPPPFTDMDAAVNELVKMGALLPLASGEVSETGQVTLLGEFCLKLPLDIDLCRLVLYGLCFNCLTEAIIMAAGLSLKHDCFTMPSRALIKDQESFLASLSKSIDSRLVLDKEILSDPILFVQLFWEWIKFFDSCLEKGFHSSRSNVVCLFSKKFAINCQRFKQMLTSITYIATKVMAMLPPMNSFHKQQLTVLTEFLKVDTSSITYHSIVVKLIHSNIDRLRALLAATFMHNLLYGMRKDLSFSESEKKEANIGLVRVLESGLDISKCILVKQISEGGMGAVNELVRNIVPDCPSVKINMAHNIAVIEFHNSIHLKHIYQFWQFCERRFRWSIDKMSIVFDRPYHPMEISWFCWSPYLEKVDILTWRSRTALVCDISNDHSPFIAVAASLEGVDSQTRVKAKYLTILPSLKFTKLSILLLIAFQSYSSTVMFSVDHSLNTVQSICIESQELPFGLWQSITSTDLIIVNELREALSFVLSRGSCEPYLPINNFEKVDAILSILIHPLTQKSAHPEKSVMSMLSKIALQSHGDTDSVQRPYYPKYSCSILERTKREILTQHQSCTLPYSSKKTSSQLPMFSNSECNFLGNPRESLQINIGIQASTSRLPSLYAPYDHPHSVNVRTTIPSNRDIPYISTPHTSLPSVNCFSAECNCYHPSFPQAYHMPSRSCCSTGNVPSTSIPNNPSNVYPSYDYRHSCSNSTKEGCGGGKMANGTLGRMIASGEMSSQAVSRNLFWNSNPQPGVGTSKLMHTEKCSMMDPLDQTLGSPFDCGITHGMFDKNEDDHTKSDCASNIECNDRTEYKPLLNSVDDSPAVTPPLNDASMSDEEYLCKSSEVCFSQTGTFGNVKMTDLEKKLVTFMYSKAKRASLSDILSDKELKVAEFLNNETLSLNFFLKRPQWFKVQMFEKEEEEVTYMISLLNLVPIKCESVK